MGKHIWLFFSFIFDKGVGNNNNKKVTGIFNFKFKFRSLCHHLSSEFVLSLLASAAQYSELLLGFCSCFEAQTHCSDLPSTLDDCVVGWRGVLILDPGLLAIYLLII